MPGPADRFVQCRGGEYQRVRAGDTVTAEPGEWHWHGAAPDAFMVHLAVTDGPTEWAEHVERGAGRGEIPRPL